MKVRWESDLPKNTSFKVEVYIEALDRLRLLSDVVGVLSDMGANVLSSNTVSHRDGMVEMRFLFQVSDITHIDIILSKLKGLEGVFDARRMVPKVGAPVELTAGCTLFDASLERGTTWLIRLRERAWTCRSWCWALSRTTCTS